MGSGVGRFVGDTTGDRLYGARVVCTRPLAFELLSLLDGSKGCDFVGGESGHRKRRNELSYPSLWSSVWHVWSMP